MSEYCTTAIPCSPAAGAPWGCRRGALLDATHWPSQHVRCARRARPIEPLAHCVTSCPRQLRMHNPPVRTPLPVVLQALASKISLVCGTGVRPPSPAPVSAERGCDMSAGLALLLVLLALAAAPPCNVVALTPPQKKRPLIYVYDLPNDGPYWAMTGSISAAAAVGGDEQLHGMQQRYIMLEHLFRCELILVAAACCMACAGQHLVPTLGHHLAHAAPAPPYVPLCPRLHPQHQPALRAYLVNPPSLSAAATCVHGPSRPPTRTCTRTCTRAWSQGATEVQLVPHLRPRGGRLLLRGRLVVRGTGQKEGHGRRGRGLQGLCGKDRGGAAEEGALVRQVRRGVPCGCVGGRVGGGSEWSDRGDAVRGGGKRGGPVTV